MELSLERQPSAGGCTHGDLYLDGKWHCYALEDEVREIPNVSVLDWKVPGATAIPFGRYGVVIDFSNRFHKLMPHVLNVPGFDGIRIHSGNTAADTEGCILVGLKRGLTDVEHSREAFDALFARMKIATDAGEEIHLTITSAPAVEVEG